MASRAFSVFIDDKPTLLPKSLVLPSTSRDVVRPSVEAGSSSVSSTEKENLHPLTGSRIGSVNALGSKRKSSVLTTKLHNLPEAKKLRKEDSTGTLAKKRKFSSSGLKSSREPSGKTRKTKSLARSRTVPDLPSVEEEDKDAHMARSLSQSEIDSRCYELTVSPLANVSEAFSQASSPSQERADAKLGRKTKSDEAELGATPDSNPPSPATIIVEAPIRDRSLPPPVLSTPERKRIYASFTFSSPIKPSSARRNPSSSSIKISDAQFIF